MAIGFTKKATPITKRLKKTSTPIVEKRLKKTPTPIKSGIGATVTKTNRKTGASTTTNKTLAKTSASKFNSTQASSALARARKKRELR